MSNVDLLVDVVVDAVERHQGPLESAFVINVIRQQLLKLVGLDAKAVGLESVLQIQGDLREHRDG